jgi:hypothetical protein
MMLDFRFQSGLAPSPCNFPKELFCFGKKELHLHCYILILPKDGTLGHCFWCKKGGNQKYREGLKNEKLSGQTFSLAKAASGTFR